MEHNRFSHLLSSYRIGSHVFKNRILAAPTGTLHENEGGYPRQDYLDYCKVLVDGGVARLSTLDNPVDPFFGGRGGARRFHFYEEPSAQMIEAFEEYNRMAHAQGVLTMVELSHLGRDNMGEPGYDELMVSDTALCVSEDIPRAREPGGLGGLDGPGGLVDMPSGGPKFCTQKRVMTEQDILDIADQFAHCARNVQRLGCDGVLVHGGHGQLFTQFLSAGSNHRMDQYGGSLENRMRAPILILRRIREVCGPEFLLELRVSAVSGGDMPVSLDETIAFAKAVDGLVDIFHVSTSLGTISTSAEYPPGLNVAYAAEIKKHVSMAVAVVGGINDPAMAEEIIAQDKADFICSGRQLHLADPFWPRKLQENRPEFINNCLRCATGCNGDFLCAVNPVKQTKLCTEFTIRRTNAPRKVVVVGGGIGGMKAAETAALRGHQVVLFERSSTLGGALRFADWDESKRETKQYRENMARRLKTLGVDVRLNTVATPEQVSAEEPFAVIAAMGARQVSTVSGTARNALSVYGPDCNLGCRIILVGAGLTGVETALYLNAQDPTREILLLERENRVLPSIIADGSSGFMNKTKPGGHYNPSKLVELLAQRGIETRCSAKAEQVTRYCVKLGSGEALACDTVILATGVQPLTEQAEQFRDCAPLFFNVGDSYQPGTIRDAVYSGYFAARSI